MFIFLRLIIFQLNLLILFWQRFVLLFAMGFIHLTTRGIYCVYMALNIQSHHRHRKIGHISVQKHDVFFFSHSHVDFLPILEELETSGCKDDVVGPIIRGEKTCWAVGG